MSLCVAAQVLDVVLNEEDVRTIYNDGNGLDLSV